MLYTPKNEDVCENIKQENSEYRVEKLRRRSRQICWNAAKTVPDQFATADRRSFRARALRDTYGRNCDCT
jgi:hypothetical protein